MKSQKLFLILMLIITTVTLTTACTGLKTSENPAMPSGFVGTWERTGRSTSQNTLTITSTSIKASNQDYFWNISSVSGDIYTIYPGPNPDLKGTISLKLVGDYLQIIDAYDMSNAGAWSGSDDDWTGTWKIK